MKSKKSSQARLPPKPSTSSSTNYKVFTTTRFIKEAQKLKKKYPNIGESFRDLSKELKKDPITGNDPLGKNCYKVRMEIEGKHSGESGAARVIIQVKIVDKEVFVLSVFEKGTKSDLFEKELDRILKEMILCHPK